MNLKEMATLKNAYDRRKELLEFQEELKKNPLQESEYRRLITDSNLDNKEKISYMNHISTLRENKMIIDDIRESFTDFAARYEKSGIVPIKNSIMKQMSPAEFQQLTSKKIAVYDDLNGAEKVQHYRYKGKDGLIYKTGEGINVAHQDTQDREQIQKAQQSYKHSKETIGKLLSEIEVNGDKYQNFRNDS